MSTSEKIKGFIKEEYRSAFLSDRLKVFEYDHRKLSEDYPAGKQSYFKNELFLLKKEYLNPSKYGYYTVNWIRCDCFEFAYLEGFQHLIDYCKKTFVTMFEQSARDFTKYDYKVGTTIEFFYKNRLDYIEAVIKEFYSCASKIRSLEKMMSEELSVKAQTKLNGKQSFTICDYSLIRKIYDLCIDEMIFDDNYSIQDFTNCFDDNHSEKQLPILKSSTKFCFILSKINSVNENIALNYFGIKGYKTRKKREIDKRERMGLTNKLFAFTNKVEKVFK